MDEDVKNIEHNSNANEGSSDEITNSTNVDILDLDQETSLKLRGDAIGDTLYSQSFVLRTLLQLSDFEWNEQIEEDLCFLWDMTIEKDVCEYLFEINYPSIACSAISDHNENRFVEIIIGILANISCAGCEKRMSFHEVNTVLQEFETDDTLVLIQLMRFIIACAHSSSKIFFMNENIMNKIIFILNNSTNNDLLLKALEATVKVTIDFRLAEEYVNIRLYNAVISGYCTITNDCLQSKHEYLLTSRYLLESITNICSYIDHFKNDQFLTEIKENSNVFVNEVMKIMKYYSNKQNLLPVCEDVIYCVSALRYILIDLNVNYLPELLTSLTKMLYIISNSRDELSDIFESLSELVLFIMSCGSPERVGRDLKLLSKQKVNEIIGILKENQAQFAYKIEWCEITKHLN